MSMGFKGDLRQWEELLRFAALSGPEGVSTHL